MPVFGCFHGLGKATPCSALVEIEHYDDPLPEITAYRPPEIETKCLPPRQIPRHSASRSGVRNARDRSDTATDAAATLSWDVRL